MEFCPIHNERDYKETLQIVSGLVDDDPAPGTPDGDRLEILAALVERYEAEHFPIDLPDSVEAIKFRMEQAGLSQSRAFLFASGTANGLVEAINTGSRRINSDSDTK